MSKSNQLAESKDDIYSLGSEDLLSRLPDEVLVSILSSLHLKDAAVTGLLSRRWRYLWYCQTDRLVFEDLEQWGLMSWANQVIDQHKSPTIDEFKICFGLGENAKGAITKWIKFAISKDVKTLELDLTRETETCGNYAFNVPAMEIKFLKSLILKHVDVDDEGLKKILSNCPVLEHLSILGSRKLVKPKIHGKGLALKNLDMTLCYGLKSIEIRDTNIVSFSWPFHSVILKCDTLQTLQKIYISACHSLMELNYKFFQITYCVPHLQVLELNLYLLEDPIEIYPLPELQKLKQLIIDVMYLHDYTLLVLPLLVEACPKLQRLTIRCCYKLGKGNQKVKQMAKKLHQCLEVVEMEDYSGTDDFKLAMYFIQNCVALKKLVITPKYDFAYSARQELEPRTPVSVELVIL